MCCSDDRQYSQAPEGEGRAGSTCLHAPSAACPLAFRRSFRRARAARSAAAPHPWQRVAAAAEGAVVDRAAAERAALAVVMLAARPGVAVAAGALVEAVVGRAAAAATTEVAEAAVSVGKAGSSRRGQRLGSMRD
eukprot:2485278-Prymnesium_polylepis.1